MYIVGANKFMIMIFGRFFDKAKGDPRSDAQRDGVYKGDSTREWAKWVGGGQVGLPNKVDRTS